MERSFVLDTRFGPILIADEPAYRFGSTDLSATYAEEVRLDADNATSIHGVKAHGRWSAIFGAGGGCSTVHQHSAVEKGDRLYVAVGNRLVCLDVATGSLTWSRQVDTATCFGVHCDEPHNALICHGEVEISRISLDGDTIWTAAGEDIFSEDVQCLPTAIQAVDFNRSVYLFDYETGALLNRP